MSPPPDAPKPALAVAREVRNTFQFGVVPICIIPGVMGTKIDFDPGLPIPNLVHWDPDSSATMLALSGQPPALKYILFGGKGEIRKDPADPHAALAKGFYGPLIDDLNSKLNQKANPVYSVGYDWRQSNRKSGADIAAAVRKILEKHSAHKVILITHSMGGLASRAALKFSGLEKDVMGVVHCVQPSLGAAKNYSNFIRGPNEPGVEGFFLMRILGPKAWQFTSLMSCLPGPVQLLPNQVYQLPKTGVTVHKPSGFSRDITPDEWLQVYWEQEDLRQGFDYDIFDTYSDWRVPGVLKQYDFVEMFSDFFPGKWEKMMQDLEGHLDEAKHFHKELGDYAHPMTKVIYSSSNDTLLGTIFYKSSKWSGIEYGHFSGPGDGTVPLESQLRLKETGGWPPQIPNPHGEHAKIFTVPEVRARVVACIQGMIAEYFHGKPPAP